MCVQNVPEVMFQKGSLSAQRFLTAVKTAFPEKLETLSRQLWLRVWSKVCVDMCACIMCDH